MADPFLGEIRMFGGNFAPAGWALCHGQLLAIFQAEALFSLFGTQYGGDGETTFGLPDLRGRIPVHQGTGSGMTPRSMGQKPGTENALVTTSELPPHSHSVEVSTANAASVDPSGKMLANASESLYRSSGGSVVNMAAGHIDQNAGGQTHRNVQPFLAINYIVALVGLYPSPS